jgi:hypothetical protein
LGRINDEAFLEAAAFDDEEKELGEAADRAATWTIVRIQLEVSFVVMHHANNTCCPPETGQLLH